MPDLTRHDLDQLPPAGLVAAALHKVSIITDPLEKALAAGELMQAVREAGDQLRDIRVECVQTLNETMGYGQIATALGVTKARAQQLANDARSPKRPGVIEVQARVEAASLRNSGATDIEVVETVLPKMREHRGGDKLTLEQIAKALGVSSLWLKPLLDHHDETRGNISDNR